MIGEPENSHCIMDVVEVLMVDELEAAGANAEGSFARHWFCIAFIACAISVGVVLVDAVRASGSRDIDIRAFFDKLRDSGKGAAP